MAYGSVRLDGVRAAVAVKWPGAIHEGNGVAAIFIDKDASPQQRDALSKIDAVCGPSTRSHVEAKIVYGSPPAWPAMIRNPVTKAEARLKVVLAQGFVAKELDQFSLKEFWVRASPELQFAHPGKCGELAKIQWQGP